MTREQARLRNWQKSRLTGFSLNTKGLTKNEREIFTRIMFLKANLLANWDYEAEQHIGLSKPLPKYKCWCGKRTNVEYLATGLHGDKVHVCKNHKEDSI